MKINILQQCYKVYNLCNQPYYACITQLTKISFQLLGDHYQMDQSVQCYQILICLMDIDLQLVLLQIYYNEGRILLHSLIDSQFEAPRFLDW